MSQRYNGEPESPVWLDAYTLGLGLSQTVLGRVKPKLAKQNNR